MAEMRLQPTVVQEVRGFLLGAGFAQRPWSGAAEVLEALTTLLDEKKDDPAFSGPLDDLLSRLIARQETLESTADSFDRDTEVLGVGELRALVAELQFALPGDNGSSRPTLASILTNLRAPALASVLLLLVAGGCDVGSGKSTGEPVIDTKPKDGAPTDKPDPVLKDVYDYLKGSTLSPSTIKALEDCLATFSDTRRQELVDLFKTKTPEEIAAHLEALAASTECKPETPEKDVMPDRMVPLYKGISFPSR